MKRFTLFQGVAALTLAIALAPGTASAQEDGTATISGTFSMDYSYGEADLYLVAPELLAVYANGHEHTWTLTLYGTTQSHSGWVDLDNAMYANITEIQATSFDLEFFGPDAVTLNGFVSEYLAGGQVDVSLQNTYSFDGWGFAIMHVRVNGDDAMYFDSGLNVYSANDTGVDTLFPTDADGYPVVGAEPFSIDPDYTVLGYLEGTGGIGSLAGPVTFEGSVGEPPPPPSLPTLAIQDGSVLEGSRGTTNLNLTVTLSASSTSTVTVNYATTDGTAVAKSDYTANSGTLTFQPGETSRTISVAIKGDRKREADETFSVQLSNAAGATIADGVATVTILNDD